MTVTAARQAGTGARGLRLRAAAVTEVVCLGVLYAGYSLARNLVPVDAGAARARAHDVLHLERLLRLDVEAAANSWLSAHAALAVAASYWYAVLHFAVTPVLLVLLWVQAPRATYRLLRTTLVVATALALIGYVAFPLMPPRMLAGYTDTMAQTAGSGWWGAEAGAPRGLGGLTNQFAAMPSMHVGWAVWCALAATALLPPGRWRVLVWLYPLGTLAVVVATANHYVVDGLAGAALVLAVLAALRRAARREPARR